MGSYVEQGEYVTIGGIEQFLFHTGDDRDNPVVLHLHGGPGMPFSNKAWLLHDWDPYFTMVYWDQRGAGKTALRNPTAVPTMDLLLEDIHEIVAHLRSRHGARRVGILAHSWGTVLGSQYALSHPEDLAFYVGVGQVVDAMEDERVGAAELRRRAEQAGAADDLATLDGLGDYPGDVPDEVLAKMLVVRHLQTRYGMASFDPDGEADLVSRSPLFTQADRGARAVSVSLLDHLYRELAAYSLPRLGHTYDVPVFYLLGADDWQVPRVQGERYFEQITAPRKELVIIECARHSPMLERPQQFLHALRSVTRSLVG